MSDKPNYHGFLHNFAPKMDKVLAIFRTGSTRENIKSNWLNGLFLRMLKEVRTCFKPISKIDGMKVTNLTGLSVVGGLIASITSWFLALHLGWVVFIGLASFVLILLCLMPYYKNKMLDIYHPFFHIPAYKKFRPNEYELLNHSVMDKHFSYTDLANYVNRVSTKQNEESNVVEIITTQLNEQKDEYKKRIKEQVDREKEIVKEYRDEIEKLNDDLDEYETVISYLVEFIQEIYVIMRRISSGMFHFSDLKMISGFTIYQMKDNELARIADEGTTGQTPKYIDLNQINHNPWVQTIIDAAKGKKELELRNNQPKEGYESVSFKFYLGESKKMWIFSLQIHRSTNPRGFLLALSDNKIDKRVIYEMLFGLCSILDDKLEGEKRKGEETFGSRQIGESS